MEPEHVECKLLLSRVNEQDPIKKMKSRGCIIGSRRSVKPAMLSLCCTLVLATLVITSQLAASTLGPSSSSNRHQTNQNENFNELLQLESTSGERPVSRQNNNSNQTTGAEISADDEPIHQLQLPLQLHLKLRPLPLPLPPPPQPASSQQLVSRKNHDEDPKARKATRSVPLQQVGRDSETWREAKRVLLLSSKTSAITQQQQQQVDRRTLALVEPPQPSYSATHEAPTVKLPHQQHLQEADQRQFTNGQAPTNPRQSSPGDSLGWSKFEPSLNLADDRQPRLTATLLPFIWPASLTAVQLSSAPPRQQQHHQQQVTPASQANNAINQEQPQTTSTNSHKKPALSYTAPLDRRPAPATSINQLRGPPADQAASSSSISFSDQVIKLIEPPKQLIRDFTPIATTQRDSIVNNGATPSAKPETATHAQATGSQQEPRQPRRKRKKPAYLQHASSSTTPYPDSFRMASKYPMPKIKYSQLQQQQQPGVGAQVNSARAITSKRLAAKQQAASKQRKKTKKVNYQPFEPSYEPSENTGATKQQAAKLEQPTTTGQWQAMTSSSPLPKSLSKLIEEKLLLNSSSSINTMTSLLHNFTAAYRDSAGLKLNPPTTSVSRVVGVLGSARRLVGATRELNDATQAQSPERVVEAAKTIASAASDAWKASNLTLDDLTSMMVPSSWLHNNTQSNNKTTPVSSDLLTTTPAPNTSTTTTGKPVESTASSEHLATESTLNHSSTNAMLINSTKAYESKVMPTPSSESAATQTRQLGEVVMTTTTSTTESPAIASNQSRRLLSSSGSEEEPDSSMSDDDEPSKMQADTIKHQHSAVLKPVDQNLVSGGGQKRTRASNGKRQGGDKESSQASQAHLFKSNKRRANSDQSQRLHNKHQQANNNIKLFHFKRKPDLNKLPFYKKPLNYTELGWSPEQIQEHLDNLAALGLPVAANDGTSDSTNANNSLILADQLAEGAPSGDQQQQPIKSHSTNDLNQQQQQESTQDDRGLDREQQQQQNQDKFLLLKRKRRQGRNQFDKLMADLHSGLQAPVQDPQQFAASSGADLIASGLAASIAQQADASKANELVPVLRKKSESLVMKPMFAHAMLNQSRTASHSSEAADRRVDDDNNEPTSGQSTNINMEQSSSISISSSKPIIRMRRKNSASEHVPPPGHVLRNQHRASAWKPITRNTPTVSEQLMLVPSGLLTPSGSHLIPLIARPPMALGDAESEQNRSLMNQFLSWRPARNMNNTRQNNQQLQQPSLVAGSELDVPASLIDGAISAQTDATHGLQAAMSGPVSSLVMPPPVVLQQPNAKPPRPLNVSEQVRVPKLLVKPMRPAKYSLNGYIPKPSLVHSDQQANNNGNSAQPAAPSSTLNKQQQQHPSSKQQHGSPQSSHLQSRDLDSSTSNEIFSRRRGGLNGANDKHLLQLEENKKKYIMQQQERSPTLSAHKANLIKAKLGLIPAKHASHQANASNNSGSSKSINNGSLLGQASTNSISHLSRDGHQQQQQPAGQQHEQSTSDDVETPGAQLGGVAPAAANNNAIPKTDFECTDKQGKFVSGLFADYKTNCQVWHLCSNNRKYSFLCPAGTVFNSKARICDWRYNVKCDAESTLPR